jgi:hypothetical protein
MPSRKKQKPFLGSTKGTADPQRSIVNDLPPLQNSLDIRSVLDHPPVIVQPSCDVRIII